MKEQNESERDGDGWWIDFMEGELDPSIMSDVEWLLKHSPADQEKLREYVELKKAVAESDWGQVTWQASDWCTLQEKIMMALDQQESSSAVKSSPPIELGVEGRIQCS